MSSKINYKKLDILRIILCISVLLYHFNILKGGYLAVCSFLTISGYLLGTSLLKKDNFSLKEHFKKRLKKLYIPLLLVVLLELAIIPLFKNIHWINLKPETTSVLLNYNNIWQININQDYFARTIESPFVHMWYISLLIQLELIIPLFIKITKKIKNKNIQTIITAILSLIATIYFYKTSLKNNMTLTYYSTFTRMFSYLYGLLLAYIQTYYKNKTNESNICYILYIIILTIMFITIKSTSPYFNIACIITSLITLKIIKHSKTITKENKLIKKLSNITYEIYLLQYPIMYIFNYIEMNQTIKTILILIFLILLAKLIYLLVNTDNKKLKTIIILPIILFGTITYIKTKDYTKEMNELKKQLKQNEELLKQIETTSKENIKQNEEKLNNILEKDILNQEELNNLVENLPLIAIGDSVMLGAINEIKTTFKNSYVDAKISRSIWLLEPIINDLDQKNMLGNPIIIHLGTNGDCTKLCKNQIMQSLKNKKVFWINTTNLLNVNNNLKKLEQEYENLEIIDWYNLSKNHQEYFYADGIHLTNVGRKEYTKIIYEKVYNYYQKENETKKENILKEYEENIKNNITFYGNEMLLNVLNNLSNEYPKANIYIEKSYESLYQKLTETEQNKTITNKIILIYDKTFDIDINKYNELKNKYKNNQIYLITTKNLEQTHYIEEKYTMSDGIHLNKEGNEKLLEIIKKITN